MRSQFNKERVRPATVTGPEVRRAGARRPGAGGEAARSERPGQDGATPDTSAEAVAGSSDPRPVSRREERPIGAVIADDDALPGLVHGHRVKEPQ